MTTTPILQTQWSQHAQGPMFGTAASTDSTRRRRRRSAIARTRCEACASAIARPTPNRSVAGRRSATSSTATIARRSTATTRPARPPSTVPPTRPRQARTTPADGRCARDVDVLTEDLGEHQAELAKLELAERTLERTWLFLERGDATLLTEVGGPDDRGRDPDADRRGPGGRALAARPGDPRRTGPGAQQHDLPGRVHRADHRFGPAPRPHRAALPARAPAPRAGRRPGVHQPAPPADARRAGAGRRHHRLGRAHADADRARDHRSSSRRRPTS